MQFCPAAAPARAARPCKLLSRCAPFALTVTLVVADLVRWAMRPSIDPLAPASAAPRARPDPTLYPVFIRSGPARRAGIVPKYLIQVVSQRVQASRGARALCAAGRPVAGD